MTPFFDLVRARYPEWACLPLENRDIPGWTSWGLVVPPPPGSDLAGPLEIDEIGDEITISLDLTHMHFYADDRKTDGLWGDPVLFLEAVLQERILATTAFLNGRMKSGSLIELGEEFSYRYAMNVDHVRARTWRGTHDWDDVKIDGVWKRSEARIPLPPSQ